MAGLARAIAPVAPKTNRRFRALLRSEAHGAAETRAYLAIVPSAASNHPSLSRFLENVDYHCARLAKLNVAPDTVKSVLQEFEQILESELPGRFQPAREQLQLLTHLTLETAYHRVREAESQLFFGLYRAELEAKGLEDLLRRFIRLLAKAFHARAVRLLPTSEPAQDPLYLAGGNGHDHLIHPSIRGRYASYWLYPLSPSAIVQFGFPARYPWLPRELALLKAAGERCREAIERTRLQSEIRRLEALARSAEEEERRRIGRELHDAAGQSLLLLRMQLEIMERRAPADLRAGLQEARSVADRTVEDLRRVVAALSPAVLERLGLASAMRQLAARFQKTHPARIHLRIASSAEPLSLPFQQVIYRVTQECFQNIAKHSGATEVNLSLTTADKRIRLTVTDNGSGFSTEAAQSKPMSFGLAGMRERAQILGGNLTVRSALRKGTRITLDLPRPLPK